VRRGVLPEALKEERKMNLNQNLSNSKIEGLKAGISDIMQGLVTLNKVLTMIQVPESAKYPDGRSQLHDSHVEAYKRHHGIHVECRDRFKVRLHDGHVQLWKEQKKAPSPMLQAALMRSGGRTRKEPR
jgi:hypothetical protein